MTRAAFALRRLLTLLLVLVLGASVASAVLAEPPRPSAAEPTSVAILPPGAFASDPGPSPAIFPPQSLTIRFDHKKHVGDLKMTCRSCHVQAGTSRVASDRLLPPPSKCDDCHGSSHAKLDAVTAGPGAEGQCAFCHLGYDASQGNKVAPLVIPPPNLKFNHAVHVGRNIGCQQCHGEVQELELATRDQLPRMRGCFGCHQHPDATSRGNAKASCETCHIEDKAGGGGRMKTAFASGALVPPRWMHNAQHGPDWIERHRMVAANDSQFCASCHKEEYCTGCHDGRVRPRSVHPNDYISMHPVEARLAMQRCTSCHQEQSFCVTCHQRSGVSMSGPAGVRESGRFHPPKAIWSDAPRKTGHHAFEAQRNLNACVGCHVERDCVLCHGGTGVGAGFNPHRRSFVDNCGAEMRKNPRPCYSCHSPSDGALARCK